MRIAVLAYNLRAAGGLSVGKNIILQLPNIGPEHTYLIFVPKGAGYSSHEGKQNVEVKEVPQAGFVRRVLFDLFYLPKMIKKFHPDVIWALGNMGLSRPPCRQVILVHQPHIIYESKHYGKITFLERIKIAVLIKWWLGENLKHTDLVLCQTPVARDRFARSFNYSADKIKIMPNAVSRFAMVDKLVAGIPSVFENSRYFNLFFLTKFYSHKNLEVLIDIFRKYPARLKDVRCIVTVTPQQHPNAQKFLSDISRYNLQEHILNVGPLEQKDLAGYYYNSNALLFPTLLESFSVTYLEAMHFGLPILTSDLDFARYVCGDAALYFNPWDSLDIVNKINDIKNDASLRERLVKNGSRRISSFFHSWEEITTNALKDITLLCK
jgi:glycosyltransferase involved in cell wall biosynthesis